MFKYAGFFVALVFFLIILSSCRGHTLPPNTAFNYITRQLDDNNLTDMTLTIYYMHPLTLTRMPVSVSDLRDGLYEYRVVVESHEMKEHLDLFSQLTSNTLISTEQRGVVNVRIYYVFESNDQILLDVAMWSMPDNIIVNGREFKSNDAFLNIIMPFLPESASSFLGGLIGEEDVAP